MSTLRISDAPLLPDVDGTEKIPTGGRGDYAISVDQIKDHIFQDIGKELVGLGNVDNTSDLDKPVSTAQQAALNLKADKTYVDINLDLKADKTSVYTRSETSLALSKKADLVNGFVPESQIPSSFNDVLEFTTPNLPIIGESGKIYVTTDTNKTWRWATNRYVEISGWNPDSVSKSVTLPTYYTKEDAVDPVTGVTEGAYFNVKSLDEDTNLIEYQNIGGVPTPSGKSYPSAAAVSAIAIDVSIVRESIIDPQTDQATASKLYTSTGETQEEVNAYQRKRNRRLVYVDDYGDVGNGQDATQAFRDAVADAGIGGRVAFGDGDYLLTQPNNILSGQEVFGSGRTLLINGFDRTAFPRGSVAGLIQWGFSLNGLGAQTTIYSIGTLASPTTMLANTLTLVAPPPASLKVGSVISLHYFCARVLAISGNTLALDRTCPYIRDAGSTVYAFNETNNVHIHDFDIDFNGTESNIRWGYGVLGQGGRSNKIENINGQYIGSKMIQLSKDVDSVVRNCDGFIGTDNFDTGGHGYVLRLSSGVDSCRVENVTGTKVRHVTDVSGAHRNRFFNCKGTLTDGVAHLTHGSGSYDNRWIDADSDYSSAAYHSWDGDILTQFIGGDVRGRLTNATSNYDPSTVFRGQVVTNPAGYSGAKLELTDLTITFQAGQTTSMFRHYDATNANVSIKNSTLTFDADSANNALMYATGTGAVNLLLEDCTLIVNKIGAFATLNAASKITLKNCKLICIDTTANTPLITGDGTIEIIGGSYEFKTSGLSFFGLLTETSKLLMSGGVVFKNASQIWRRYVNGVSIALGETQLINSTFAAFSNINWSSIGVANNITNTPPPGTWAEGSRIEVANFVAGGFSNYVYLGGVWKGYGAIQA